MALGKTSVTFVNDMIARAVLGSFAEALKVGPGADRLHEADPLDLVGQIQHFQATEDGMKIVRVANPMYDPNAPEGDEDREQFFEFPAYITKLEEYGSHDGDLNNDNGQYCTAIVASITNAADKPHKTRAE